MASASTTVYSDQAARAGSTPTVPTPVSSGSAHGILYSSNYAIIQGSMVGMTALAVSAGQRSVPHGLFECSLFKCRCYLGRRCCCGSQSHLPCHNPGQTGLRDRDTNVQEWRERDGRGRVACGNWRERDGITCPVQHSNVHVPLLSVLVSDVLLNMTPLFDKKLSEMVDVNPNYGRCITEEFSTPRCQQNLSINASRRLNPVYFKMDTPPFVSSVIEHSKYGIILIKGDRKQDFHIGNLKFFHSLTHSLVGHRQ